MRPISLLVIAIMLFLPGCASQYGQPLTQVNYYPQCYQPLQELRNDESSVRKNTGAGALLGAFAGSMIGLIATGGKWEGALVGGAVGGTGGAVAGNVYGQNQRERNANIRMSSYLRDIDGNIAHLDITSASARAALQCYDQQFQLLLAAIKNRQISREIAARRFSEIYSGREEAIRLLDNAAEYARNLNVEYENAFNQEAMIAATPRADVRNQAAVQRNIQSLQTARQRQQQLKSKTQHVQRQREVALSESQRQTREINEAFATLNEIKS